MNAPRSLAVTSTLLLLGLASCDAVQGLLGSEKSKSRAETESEEDDEPKAKKKKRPLASASASASATAAPSAEPAAELGAMVRVEAGTLKAGSACAAVPRATNEELSAVPVELGAFEIDALPYPNRAGEPPLHGLTRAEAEAKCREQGKRLCSEDEWTFACEGEEATPYPYGYTRSADKCPIDARWKAFNERAMHPRDGKEAMLELDKLWQGVASGDRPDCRSASGVYDLTGNIDEWTRSVREGERPSILKGGYWGPVRTRCRPSTRSHDENHVFYQQGFRCCADVPKASASSADEPPAPPPKNLGAAGVAREAGRGAPPAPAKPSP